MQPIASSIARRWVLSPATLAYNMIDVHTSQMARYVIGTRASAAPSACTSRRAVGVVIATTTTKSRRTTRASWHGARVLRSVLLVFRLLVIRWAGLPCKSRREQDDRDQQLPPTASNALITVRFVLCSLGVRFTDRCPHSRKWIEPQVVHNRFPNASILPFTG